MTLEQLYREGIKRGARGWCGTFWHTGPKVYSTHHVCKLPKRHKGKHRCVGLNLNETVCRSWRARGFVGRRRCGR